MILCANQWLQNKNKVQNELFKCIAGLMLDSNMHENENYDSKDILKEDRHFHPLLKDTSKHTYRCRLSGWLFVLVSEHVHGELLFLVGPQLGLQPQRVLCRGQLL